jgi:serine/threonine protein kinase
VSCPRCTLAYAAPEVALAANGSRKIEMTADQDIWALGVMAFEAITQKLTLNTMKEMYDCASGSQGYPCAPACLCALFFCSSCFQCASRSQGCLCASCSAAHLAVALTTSCQFARVWF